MKKIGIIVGSNRVGSINRQLAEALIAIGHKDLTLSLIEINELPMFSEDLEKNQIQSVDTFREAVRSSDLILFITPEYNRSIPAFLKNAIDWGSRPYRKGAFIGKEAASAGLAPSPLGTAMAQNHLRSMFQVLGLKTIRQPEMYLTYHENMFQENKLPSDEKTHQFLQSFLNALAQ